MSESAKTFLVPLDRLHHLNGSLIDVEEMLSGMGQTEIERAEKELIEQRPDRETFGRDFLQVLAEVAEKNRLAKAALFYRRCRSRIAPTVVDQSNGMQDTIQGVEEALIKNLDEQLHAGSSVEEQGKRAAQLTVQELKLAAEAAEKLECWRAAKWYREMIKARE